MRVLSAHAGADTGGVGWGTARAFQRHPTPGIEFRSTVSKPNWLAYPVDLSWDQALNMWPTIDVAHWHNNTRTERALGARPIPYVLHHHGTFYRNHTADLNAFIAQAGPRARAVVSTLDLLDYGPNLTWIPQAHDLDRLAQLRAEHRTPTKGRKLRVAHAPTDRGIKDTEVFLAACDALDVEPVLIENRPWAECLAIKAGCDALYDQVQLGYGANAIEAWGLGLPVIAGASNRILELMVNEFGPDLPFLVADTTTIGDAIKALTREDTRAHYADLGTAHVHRWHDGAETVARLTTIYQDLAPHAPMPRPKRKPGTRDLIFRVGAPSEELRWAIRSQTTNMPGIGRVITAGVPVPWLNTPHIHVPHRPGMDKYAHAHAVLRAILEDDNLTPEVIISDDDMHLLEPLNTLPSYTQGRIADVPTRTRAQAWADTMNLVGPDAPMLDVHVPTIVNRARLKAQLDSIDLPAQRLHRVFWRTLHGPTGPVVPLTEPKIGKHTTPWPDGPWVSTTERVMSPLLRLAKMFPEPSEWEQVRAAAKPSPHRQCTRCPHPGCIKILTRGRPYCQAHTPG